MKPTEEEKSKQMAEVLRLHLVEGKGVKPIAKQMKMHRKTVKKLLGMASGIRKQEAPQPRPSILAPHMEGIRQALDDCPDIHAPAVLDRLRAQGYQGGITVVRDQLKVLRPRPKAEAFFTREYGPGQMLQVDWADFGFALPGCARRVSAFVAALAFSRYLYIEFVLSQAMGTFLRCMDRALRFFGGRTLVDVFDGMKTVVKERAGNITVINQRFLEYSSVRGFGVQVCPPRRPTGKPYVERPIGFVRTRYWPGRRFSDLFDLNVQAAAWRDDIANNRIHDDTGKVPSLVFKNEERHLLESVPNRYFDTDDIETCGVSKTFRVKFDRNIYTVPWRLIGQTVLVRANDGEVGIFLGPKRVAVHNRSWDVGKVIKDPSHEQGLLEHKPRAAVGALPPELRSLGETAATYFKILAANSRSLRKEIERLVLLSELFGDSPTRSAVEEVMATGHVGAEYVEYVLRHKKGLLPTHTPLYLGNQELDGIRLGEPDLSLYDVPRKTLDPGDPPSETP